MAPGTYSIALTNPQSWYSILYYHHAGALIDSCRPATQAISYASYTCAMPALATSTQYDFEVTDGDGQPGTYTLEVTP